MQMKQIKELIKTSEYDFLRTNKNLDRHILMLGLGGSHAYGTNVEGSDLDIRGVAINEIDDLLLGKDFEQIVDVKTDTVVYSLKKMFHLLTQCNPNTVEILGLSDDQLLMTSLAWKRIRNNQDLFLSKRCINTFGGYANAQLRRLETKSARELGQAQKESYIYGSIKNAENDFKERYQKMESDSLRLYIDESEKEDFDTEIMVDINCTHYPLRDLSSLFTDYHNIIRGYDKIGARNKKAILHDKIGKHMMHLVRLYYMVFDILEKGLVKTYRDQEHDLLMEIRNGKYLKNEVEPTDDFYRLADGLQARLDRDKEITKLPDEPDMEKINNLYLEVLKEWQP